jgi:regulator of cell morphogenesis and NO signaling
MQFDSDTIVADLAARSLDAVRVFERFGIDYCCGGKRPLGEACTERGIDAGAVQRELTEAMSSPAEGNRDWTTEPLPELIHHIVSTHHEYLKREFQPLSERLAKVYRVYNERYGPTLTGLPEVFAALRSELEMHLMKEEQILFPAIESAGQAASPCGSIAGPIRMMESEHAGAGDALAKIRSITGDFAIPEYACVTYRALMAGLQELEKDLHLHIHLENNILFPRALELERTA